MKKFILALLVLVIILLTQVGRSFWQAALILPNLVPGSHARPLDFVTKAPGLLEVKIEVNGTLIPANLYVPSGNIHKTLLLIPGASELGKDDPRIVNFGETLARAGVATLIPDFPTITADTFNAQSIGQIKAAFNDLNSRYPSVKAGMAAFSIATGPMFIAAADPSIAARVHYIISFGGYYDLKDVLRSATTDPNRDPLELTEVKHIFEHSFGSNESIEDLLANTDPRKFDELYVALPKEVPVFVNELSPATQLGGLIAPKIFLIHSNPDTDVPTAESLKLKAALDRRADLVTLRSFAHTDVRLVTFTPKTLFTFYLPEAAKLYWVLVKILNA